MFLTCFVSDYQEVDFILYRQVKKRDHELDKIIQELEHRIQSYPEGNLICCHEGKYVKWYISYGKHREYIAKKDFELIGKMVKKKFLMLRLNNLYQEKKATTAFLEHFNKNAFQEEQDFLTSEEYKPFLANEFIPLSEELNKWMKETYSKNRMHPEALVHNTYSGEKVRSKSEALIASLLYKNKIPYRYECILDFEDVYVFPDFTIRHPVTGEIFYWEHFGRMDEAAYIEKTFNKLKIYTSNGIIPTIHLITTYETKKNPLSIQAVEEIIKQYFL